jgi:hypothetical protein
MSLIANNALEQVWVTFEKLKVNNNTGNWNL